MPRNMSFALTTNQVKAQTKDVTRRFGWWFLKPGDRLWAVEKSMGLKKGETVKRLCLIEVVSTRPEPLNAITQADVVREGFPDWTPADFINFLVKHYRCDPTKTVNRIEFKYLLTFDAWIKELEKDPDVIRGYGVPLRETTGLECWYELFEDGYTPRDAILMDMSYWE